MFKNATKDKGIALAMALFIIMSVVLLANVLLIMITSQSRLTHHKVSRIQAYYAAQAGMNYALEMLRIGPSAGGWTINSCPNPPPNCDCTISDADFPQSIKGVCIQIIPRGEAGCSSSRIPTSVEACVRSSVNYTYTSP